MLAFPACLWYTPAEGRKRANVFEIKNQPCRERIKGNEIKKEDAGGRALLRGNCAGGHVDAKMPPKGYRKIVVKVKSKKGKAKL